MPKQINSAGVGQRLVQLFALKGRFQPVLDEVIVPVVSVDPEGVEQRPATAYGAATGAAAERGIAGLENTGTTKWFRLQQIWVRSSVADNVYIVPDATWTVGLTGAMTAAWRDTRLGGSPDASTRIGRTTFDNAAAAIARREVATTWTVIDFPYLVSPGHGIYVQAQTTNLVLYCVFLFTEQDIVTPGYR